MNKKDFLCTVALCTLKILIVFKSIKNIYGSFKEAI